MSDRTTPETDANIWASIAGCIKGQHGEPIEQCYVPVNFARTLERQRDEAREDGLEQARLLGMGGEREARLITERDELLAALRNIEFAMRIEKLSAAALEAATELVNQWEGKA